MSGHGNRDITGLSWSLSPPIFLETGLIDTRPTQENWESKHSFLYYSSQQKASLAGSCPKWLDQIRVRSNINKTGCGIVRTPDIPVDNDRPQIESIESLAFQGIGYNNPRSELRFPSPGYATGKLKLFCQALLGSVGDKGENSGLSFLKTGNSVIDDDKTQSVISIIQNLLINPYVPSDYPYISQSRLFSRGLYTTNDYKYWLLRIDGYILSVAEVKLSVAAQKLRTAFVSNLEEKPEDFDFLKITKIESYIFSTVTEFDSSFIITVTGLDEIIGEPIHEGWKFNYLGNEAQIVTDEIIYADYGGVSNRVIKHIFRRYKLALTYISSPTPVPDDYVPFSAVLSLEEEVDATPTDAAWRPDTLTYQYRLVWNDWSNLIIGSRRGYPEYLEYDAPVYCFYQIDDEGTEGFVTVRVKYQAPTSSNTNPKDIATNITSAAYICSVPGTYTQYQEIYDVVEQYNGFYISTEENVCNIDREWLDAVNTYTKMGVVDYSVTISNNGSSYSHAIYSLANTAESCEGGTFQQRCLDQGAGFGAVLSIEGREQWTGGDYVGRIVYDGGGTQEFTFGSALVFPFGDGQSVYIVRSKKATILGDNETQINKKTAIYYEAYNTSEADEDWSVSDYFKTYVDPATTGTGIPLDNNNTFWLRSTNKLAIKSCCCSSRSFVVTFDEECDSKGYTTLYNRDGIIGSIPPDPYTTDQQMGLNYTYFDSQDLSYPWIDYPINAYESYSGILSYLQQLGTFTNDMVSSFEPENTCEDDNLPVAIEPSRVLEFVYTGWA